MLSAIRSSVKVQPQEEREFQNSLKVAKMK